MHKFAAIVYKEFRELLPPTIFFLIAFNLIALTIALNLKQYHIPFTNLGLATVAALIVGKVVLITDKFPFINKFPSKPLIYNVVWKTVIYTLAAVLVRYLESLVHLIFQYKSLSLANRHLFEEMVWPRFWAIQIWLLVIIFLYCGFRELMRVVGRQTVIEMFFGRRAQ
jgi:hypothetical protein